MVLPTPPSPPLNQVSSSPSQPSQVHPSYIQPPASASTAPKRQELCKWCGHPRKGHTYPKNKAVRCPRCSNGVCATNDTCTSTHKHSTAMQPTLHYGHIAEYILPYHLSQATIFGFPIGSNACTVIAAIGAMKFLHGELPMPSPQETTPCGTEISITTPWPCLLISLIWMPGRPCRQDKITLD